MYGNALKAIGYRGIFYMYTYRRAVGRKQGVSERWHDVDLTLLSLAEALQQYQTLWVWVKHWHVEEEQTFDLTELRQELYADPRSFPDWVNTIGNRALPVVDTPPVFETHTVRYKDAWSAGYRVDPIGRNSHPDVEYAREDVEDLLLTHPTVDLGLFHRHCLVSINGHLHRTDHSPYGIHVMEGNRSGLLANRTEVGILSFLGVGELECVTISPDMVERAHPEQSLGTVAVINTGRDLDNKTVLLSLGGYLHVLDDSYAVMGNGRISVHLQKVPFPQRWFDGKRRLYVDSIPLSASDTNKDLTVVEELYGDDAVTAYLTLSQSFLILVDAKDLYVDRHGVERTHLPGRYVAHHTGEFPLIGAQGALLDYHRHREHDRYVLAAYDARDTYYQFETTRWQRLPLIDSSKVTARMWDYSRPYLLEIGRDL